MSINVSVCFSRYFCDIFCSCTVVRYLSVQIILSCLVLSYSFLPPYPVLSCLLAPFVFFFSPVSYPTHCQLTIMQEDVPALIRPFTTDSLRFLFQYQGMYWLTKVPVPKCLENVFSLNWQIWWIFQPTYHTW